MSRNGTRFGKVLIVCVLVFLSAGCKKEKDDNSLMLLALAALGSNSRVSYGGTRSPGDVLTGEMAAAANSRTFVLTNLTTNETVRGSVTTYSGSPFVALVSAPSYTQGGFALPIAGVGLMATPVSGYTNAGGSAVTSMRAEVYAERSTDCGDFSGSFNTVQSAFGGAGTQGGYGLLTITGTSQKFIAGTITTLGGAGAALNLNNGTCTDGKVTWGTGETAYISTTGVLILDMGTNLGGYFGLKADTTLNGSAVLNGKTLLGFDNLRGTNASTVDTFVNVKFVCTSGTCTGVNIDARTLAAQSGGTSSTTVPALTNGLSASTTFGTAGGGVPLAATDNIVLAARSVNGKLTVAMLACSTGGCTAASQRHFGLYTEQ